MQDLFYILHSGQMFGTERMALATLQMLGGRFRGTVLAPPGPVHAAARALGLRTVELATRWHLPWHLAAGLWRQRHAAVLATGVAHSLWAAALQALLGGRGAHLHLVHGGTDERLSYGRKRLLRHLPLRFVAVSRFVRSRLVAHGVPAERVEVVHNFLSGAPAARRAAFTDGGVRRVAVISRLDRIKRVGLLFDALERTPALAALQFDIYGSGEQELELRQRARAFPNVRLHGFVPDAAAQLAGADLLLHTCPEEPFGLVLLEAFAAGVPVLVANAGGTGEIVREGANGWRYTANDPVALGRRLSALALAPASHLAAVVRGARDALLRDYDPALQSRRYAELAGGAPR